MYVYVCVLYVYGSKVIKVHLSIGCTQVHTTCAGIAKGVN